MLHIIRVVIVMHAIFAYYDIDINPNKFKRKVRLPKLYREDEEALDVEDIRTLLLACNKQAVKFISSSVSKWWI